MEFKINITETDEKYIRYLIIGLVQSGYEVYFDFEKEHLVFTGYISEVCDMDVLKKEIKEWEQK